MTWRPGKYLLEGELDNSRPGRVSGWLRFAGMKEAVTVDLEGDFDRDIRGQKLRLKGRYFGKPLEAEDEMEGFGQLQAGEAGHITAGLAPASYTPHPYIEWESEANGRVVLMPEPEQVTVVSTVRADPGPADKECRDAAASEGSAGS